MIDFKIYIDTDESLRRHWKILRDTKKRGYSTQKILEQIEARMVDAVKYIYPQKVTKLCSIKKTKFKQKKSLLFF